jgi:hypothetical protein
MSIGYTDIIRGAYQLLGRPSQLDLPYQDVIDHAKDVIRGRLLDMKLAARNHTNVVGPWVTPTSREMSSSSFVGGADNFIPVKVEWRATPDSETTFPRRAEVVAYEQLGDLYRSTTTFAETYVAFTDNFTKIAFSETDETLEYRQYRIIYETLEDPTVALGSTTANFPALFITLCKYETAIMCLDHVTNETVEWAERRERLRGTLAARYQLESARFDKWNTTLYGNKKVKRLGFRTRTR